MKFTCKTTFNKNHLFQFSLIGSFLVILLQSLETPLSVDLQLNAKKEVRKQRREQATEAAHNLKKDLPHTLKRAMEFAQEKGASSWLTALPIEEFGFTLYKRAFQDALALRYNWQPQNCPATCGCGARFSIEHSLSCPKGGFPSIRHRDLTANLLTEICSDVRIEPDMQPLTVICHL